MPAPTRDLLRYFNELHHAKLGAPAVIIYGKDAKILARLHESHGTYVRQLMARFFAERNDWVEAHGYTVGIFASQFARLLVWFQRDEARAARFDWETECNQLHGGTCSTAFVHDARTVRKPA